MSTFSVQYVPEDDIIRVQIRGEFDAEALSTTTSKLAEEIKLSNCTRILMDHLEATPKLSVADSYYRPHVAASLGVPRYSRIAIVYSKPSEVYEFIETVGLNQGFVVKVFRDIEAGIQWLKES